MQQRNVSVGNEGDGEDLVRVEPENVIVFYRNEFQSASTIKITKSSTLNCQLRFQLKSTNRYAYLVSESSGVISSGVKDKYINILIKEQTPLEQCLHDRFKLLLTLPGKPPLERKFKVIIDYKKDVSKVKDRDFGRLEATSKTSSSTPLTASPSVLGQPLAAVKRSMLKNSQLANYLNEGRETERFNIKEQLDQVVKNVQQRRLRLEYLQRQIQKNQSRKRFLIYLATTAIIISFLLGIIFRKAAFTGWEMAQQRFYSNDVQQE